MNKTKLLDCRSLAKTVVYLAMVTAIIQLSSCSDDDKPQTLPSVETLTAVASGTTSGTVTGEITDDGNAGITEAGFVYSSIVPEPTTAETKKVVTDLDAFQAELTELASGTTYNVRAYAINKKGTAYGTKRTFTTGNAAPVASDVQVTGTLEVGKTLTASFTYSDAEGDAQGNAGYQWYVANDATGAGEVAITGATDETFVVQDTQQDKFISVAVTPKALAGTLVGAVVKSSYNIAIGAETVTFDYMGTPVTYGTIIGTSGKKWLDRNLGATRAAQSVDDYLAYGDLFQWGRAADGHQTITRSGKGNGESVGANGTTTTKSPTVTAPDNLFVIWDGVSLDWLATQNDNLWQDVNGVNNPCPTGWRVPTQDEWNAEAIATISDGFDKLKITYTGYREAGDGEIYSLTNLGGYTSSTTGGVDGDKQSIAFSFRSTAVSSALRVRANGYACRCIKE